MKRFLIYWVPFIAWAFILCYLSSRPAYFFPKTNIPFSDKIVHIFEYAIFAFLLFRALRSYSINFKKNFIIFLVIYAAIIFGLTDELHQAFVVGRTPSTEDLLADLIGSVCGIILYIYGGFSKIQYT